MEPDLLLDAAHDAGARASPPTGVVCLGHGIGNGSDAVGAGVEQAAIGTSIAAGRRGGTAPAAIDPSPASITPRGACRRRIGAFVDALPASHLARPRGIAIQFGLEGLLPQAIGPAQIRAARAGREYTP